MKLFVSDFDGTLRRGDDRDANLDAIRRWQASGNRFGIATGRDLSIARECLSYADGLCDVLLCCNGAVAFDRDEKILFMHTMSPDAIHPMWDIATEFGAASLVVERAYDRNVLISGEIRFEDRVAEAIGHGPCCQITTYIGNEDAREAAKKKIASSLADTLSVQQNGGNCDCPPVGCTKSTGIAEYAALIGCVKSDIFTAGDDLNDIPMLSDYRGFAMEGSVPSVIASAAYTVPSVAAAIGLLLENQ